MAKLEASDTVVLGISIDSPAANAAFAKQIGVTFPLLSDMNRKVLTAYGILKPYDVQGDNTNGRSAPRSWWIKTEKFSTSSKATAPYNPNSAVAISTNLHKPKS